MSIFDPNARKDWSKPDNDDMGDYRFLERIPIESTHLGIDLLQWLLVIKFFKTDPNLLKELIEHREEAISKMVNALAQASAGHGVIAMGATHIIAQLLEHNFYIRKGGALSIQDSMSKLVGVEVAAGAANIVFQSVGSFTKGLGALKGGTKAKE